MHSNDNDGRSGEELAAEILSELPAPPFEEYRDAGEDWPTDPNDAAENVKWLIGVLRLTPDAQRAMDDAEARGDVVEVNRLLRVASACARARLALAEKGSAA